MKEINFKLILKNGVIMGIVFCLYTTFMWLTKLDTIYLEIGQYLDVLIILLPISIIIWCISQVNKQNSISFSNRILVAIFISVISYIIYEPYLYVYHHFINPTWFKSVLDLKEKELVIANVPHEKIIDELKIMKNSNVSQSGLFRPSSIISSVVIIPLLISLLSLIFVRKKRNSQK